VHELPGTEGPRDPLLDAPEQRAPPEGDGGGEGIAKRGGSPRGSSFMPPRGII